MEQKVYETESIWNKNYRKQIVYGTESTWNRQYMKQTIEKWQVDKMKSQQKEVDKIAIL